jgi:hypothetical protein
MDRRAALWSAMIALGTYAGLARASLYTELGDAGQTAATAQTPLGIGAITFIDGELVPGTDVDIFRIRIANPATFHANSSGASFDAQLFLFTTGGVGVAASQRVTGPNSSWGLITSAFVPAAGDYLLAISKYNNDPRDASGNLIWNDLPRGTERAPDGPSATDLLDHWDNVTSYSAGKYLLELKGVEFVPSPGAAGVMTIAGLAALRRRRNPAR